MQLLNLNNCVTLHRCGFHDLISSFVLFRFAATRFASMWEWYWLDLSVSRRSVAEKEIDRVVASVVVLRVNENLSSCRLVSAVRSVGVWRRWFWISDRSLGRNWRMVQRLALPISEPQHHPTHTIFSTAQCHVNCKSIRFVVYCDRIAQIELIKGIINVYYWL